MKRHGFFFLLIALALVLSTVLGACSKPALGETQNASSAEDSQGNSDSDTPGSDSLDNTDTSYSDSSSDSAIPDDSDPLPDPINPIAHFDFNKTSPSGKFMEKYSNRPCQPFGAPTQKNKAGDDNYLWLNGSSYLSFDTELPLGNGEHSITAWVLLDRSKITPSSSHVVAGWGNYTSLSDTRLMIFQNQFVTSSYGIYTAYPVTDYFEGRWAHFAMTYSNNLYRMYLDGTLIGTCECPNGINIKDTPLYIGGFGSAGINFVGGIDDLSVYDRALNNEEIIKNMNGDISYVSKNKDLLYKVFNGADSEFCEGWNNFMYAGKNATLKFSMYIPSGFSKDKKYSVALFMCGDGGNGKTPEQIVGGNESVFVNRGIIETDEDCIYIVPAPTSRWLTVPNDTHTVYPYGRYSLSDATPSAEFKAVRQLFGECLDTMPIDSDRAYFMGYSRGTMAGFYWLAEEPELFAAATLCCGASDPQSAHLYKDVPIWTFIGSNDELVSIPDFKAVYDAYTAAGGNGRYTCYEGGTHSLKEYLARDTDVLDWLFSKSK